MRKVIQNPAVMKQINLHAERYFLTIPMQFLRILQMLKSFLENMGAGKLVLKQ